MLVLSFAPGWHPAAFPFKVFQWGVCEPSQVGRAGRFGTKGLAITFVASEPDSTVLNQVQERFDVNILPMPDSVEASLYMGSNAA